MVLGNPWAQGSRGVRMLQGAGVSVRGVTRRRGSGAWVGQGAVRAAGAEPVPSGAGHHAHGPARCRRPRPERACATLAPPRTRTYDVTSPGPRRGVGVRDHAVRAEAAGGSWLLARPSGPVAGGPF